MTRRVLAALASVVLVAVVFGCTAVQRRPAGSGSPFRTCPPQRASASAPATGRDALPAITLPCFTGGAPVVLDRFDRPMVINLWASWCSPCRAELPEFQRFTDAAGDRVGVLGVITSDTRSAAASLGQDLLVTFPMVFDQRAALQRSVGEAGLPVTLFVDAEGRLRHVDASGAMSVKALKSLVREHLDVVVP